MKNVTDPCHRCVSYGSPLAYMPAGKVHAGPWGYDSCWLVRLLARYRCLVQGWIQQTEAKQLVGKELNKLCPQTHAMTFALLSV